MERIVFEVPLGALRPNPSQPRQRFAADTLAELAASIAQHGILQPLLVTRLVDEGDTAGEAGPEVRYRIVAGERRWRAALLAGLVTVPVLLLSVSPAAEREIALIENLHRTDLQPLELAQALEAILRQSGMTQEELAQRLGKSRVTVTNTLRLLGLGYAAQQALAASRISEGHGRALLGLHGAAQEQALHTVLAHDLTVRQTETLVRRLAETRHPPATSPQRDQWQVLADALRRTLGTKVEVSGNEQAGRIVIEYHSREELERLCTHLGGEDLANDLA